MTRSQIKQAYAAILGLETITKSGGMGMTLNTAEKGGAGATHRLLSEVEAGVVRSALTQHYEGILAELGVSE